VNSRDLLPTSPLAIGFVLWPGFSPLALAAALEVLEATNQCLDEPAYELQVLCVHGHSVRGAGGLVVQARPLTEAQPVDAVFVVAEAGPHALRRPEGGPPAEAAALLAWLLAQAAAGKLLGGFSLGAAWLAEAGLLRGQRATVHWPHLATLAERHPETVVSPRVFEIDGARLSCGGGSASRELMLAWLLQRHGERLGPELAALLGLERLPGHDDRQRRPMASRLAGGGSAKLAEAVALMEANLAEPLPTEEIARLAGVSRRQLERLFRQHLDALPARWYLGLRLAQARRLLRETCQSVLQVGLACGFASGPHFSNAYRAHFGHTPRDERHALATGGRPASGTARMPTPTVTAGRPADTAADASAGASIQPSIPTPLDSA